MPSWTNTGISRRSILAGAAGAAAIVPMTTARGQQGASGAAAPAAAQADVLKVMPAITAYIAGARTATVPEPIRERARLHILDTLASIIACRDLEAAQLGRAYAKAQSGDGKSSILGSREKAGLIDAVFAGAMTGHGAEINDFIPSAFVQPGPSIVTGAFALAEQRGGTGRQVMNAIIAGYELAGRIPKTLGLRNMQRTNLANHGVGPVFGTAAMAASMLGMDADKVNHVLTYCVQQASGSWQWMLDVRHIEKSFVFAGMGARNGLQAALLVEAGFTGVPDCFDAEAGWMRSLPYAGGDGNRAYLIEGLGERFELTETAFKRYPSGGPTQPAVQALLELCKKVKADEVTRVLIEMPGRADAFRDAAMPALSLPYLASIILLDGRLDFVSAQSLERMHGDPAVQRLRKLVEVVHDPKQEAAEGQPRTESARVTIERRGKPPLRKYEPYVLGFPSHPMDRRHLEEKVVELVEPALGRARTRELIQRTSEIDDATDISGLIALVTL